MNYLSCFSGIEAATVAWEPLGWNPIGFAEIDNFPSEVLKYHYPHIPNYGDITKYKEWNIGENIDLIVGGSPCQAFSRAGLRKGLDDPRGNLALVYLGVIDKYKPKWILWENVVGVLSSNGGRDFGSFIGALGEIGYGFSWRVLDTQYFGLPQRRKRVFLVGHIGDWRPPTAVLHESGSLQRNNRKGRKEEESYIPGSIESITKEYPQVSYDAYSFLKYDNSFATLSTDSFHLRDLLCEKYVRRLTPIETERLQGFPDNYTQIPWRGAIKEKCPDTLRYKAIGNSMSAPVMNWIGNRIQMVDDVISEVTNAI